jgi:hypothetical protein
VGTVEEVVPAVRAALADQREVRGARG